MPKLYLDPEDDLTGHVDASFDMPSVEGHSCPACEEALFMEFGKCEPSCCCYCHSEEKP